MTLGDEELAREVLELFVTQAAALIGRLHGLPKDAAALTHQLKGSARGIGAMAVARGRGERLEAVLREGGDVSLALWALDMAVKARGRGDRAAAAAKLTSRAGLPRILSCLVLQPGAGGTRERPAIGLPRTFSPDR